MIFIGLSVRLIAKWVKEMIRMPYAQLSCVRSG